MEYPSEEHLLSLSNATMLQFKILSCVGGRDEEVIDARVEASRSTRARTKQDIRLDEDEEVINATELKRVEVLYQNWYR